MALLQKWEQELRVRDLETEFDWALVQGSLLVSGFGVRIGAGVGGGVAPSAGNSVSFPRPVCCGMV